MAASFGQDVNPAEARWCEQHGRLECVKGLRRREGPCHGPAIKGLDCCRKHTGTKSVVAKAKAEANISAWTAIGKMPGGVDIDAGMAVLGMLQMTWLRAAAYGELLRQQVADQVPEPDPDGFNPHEQAKPNGLIGYQYAAAGKDGNIYASSEAVRALVVLEASERDRVVKYAETAHKMGISDRLTSLAERWGDVVAGRISLILEGLDLSPEQEAIVPQLIQMHLASIDMTTMGGPQ
jgi:hypothetical protein